MRETLLIVYMYIRQWKLFIGLEVESRRMDPKSTKDLMTIWHTNAGCEAMTKLSANTLQCEYDIDETCHFHYQVLPILWTWLGSRKYTTMTLQHHKRISNSAGYVIQAAAL